MQIIQRCGKGNVKYAQNQVGYFSQYSYNIPLDMEVREV